MTGLLVCSLATLTLASPGPAAARTKTIPTRAVLSATKAPDGTVTIEAAFSSPNPRCLRAGRFHGKFYAQYLGAPVGADFYYGDAGPPHGTPPSQGAGVGFEPSVPQPISPAGRSPYVWQAAWPASTVVANGFGGNGLGGKFPDSTTVSAASGIGVFALVKPFRITYRSHGARVTRTCAAGLFPKSGLTLYFDL